MTLLATKIRTAYALGLRNVLQVGWYRARLRRGLHPVQRITAPIAAGVFFTPPSVAPVDAPPSAEWSNTAKLFGNHEVAIGSGPPDWLASPFTGTRIQDAQRNWWEIPDFDPTLGDIKALWEFSRMDWALAFAQRARNGDEASIERLNRWLDDWCARNPPYRGPQWKCAQEASIRLLHLAMASLVLGQERAMAAPLRTLVAAHLERIAPTLAYAAAQDNNHATSEAAALFVGGSWLTANGKEDARRYERLGRSQLEKHVGRLVDEEGGFSQYSLNYHRVLLDTLAIAEVWRRRLGRPPFSHRWQQRARAATTWLAAMIDRRTGDAPNVGANDGARLIQLTATGYRDFRPSVQIASALFHAERFYEPGAHDDALLWLGIKMPSAVTAPERSRLFDKSGWAVLRRESAAVIVRYPRFRFRPSQADALHLDLWIKGENCLRDAGTYSYNGEPSWMDYFRGVRSHNTIQFDDGDQMPALSRFLFGDWLSATDRDPIDDAGAETRFAVGYRDQTGRSHRRDVRLSDGVLRVIDRVGGFSRKAVLRWRLKPGLWVLEGQTATSGDHILRVESSVPISRIELVTGFESRHYFERTELPVLEVEIDRAAILQSEYRWDA